MLIWAHQTPFRESLAMHLSYAKIKYMLSITYGVRLKPPPTVMSKAGALLTICLSNFTFSTRSARMLAPVKCIPLIPLQFTMYIDVSYVMKITKSPRVFDEI
jgi:hypothetical protein